MASIKHVIFLISFCLPFSSSLPLAVITVFSSQGNNCPDAIIMADHIDQWLSLVGEGKEGGRREGNKFLCT